MAKTAIKQNFELTTRNSMTRVNAEVSLMVDGRELPTMGVLGSALESAIATIQEAITKSYEVVPERVGV